MSQPPAYNRAISFTNYQAANPTAALQGSSVDLELNNAKATLDAIRVNLALIQRDDGALANESVGLDQLADEVPVGFNAPSVWVTATAYTAGSSTVFNGSGFYRCLVSHTSGTFATDLAALKWELIVNLAAIPLVTATQIAVTPSGLLTTNVQTSLQALDAGKAALSHTHLAAAISDSSAAGRSMLTAANLAAQQTLLGLGALAYLNTIPVTAITAQLAFTGAISPAALGSNTNDWTPTGWATCAIVKMSASVAVNITGFAATSDGDIKIIQNTGSFAVTVPFGSASSAAANRVAGPAAGSFVIQPGSALPLMYDSTASLWRPLAPLTAVDQSNYLTGLTLSTAGSSATMSIAAGSASDSTNVGMMTLASAISKTTASWAVGTGNGGIDTGAIANSTWYHFYLIKRVDTGVIDVLFSLSASAPTMPTNYTLKRRIGSGKTDGSAQWTLFTQTGDTFIWSASVADVAGTAVPSSRTNITLTVPTGIVVEAKFRITFTGAGGGTNVIVTSLQESDQTPTTALADVILSASQIASLDLDRLTDTSARISIRASSAVGSYNIGTYGWRDLRGK